MHVSFIVSMLLAIVGFILPPQGEISGSVLTFVGKIDNCFDSFEDIDIVLKNNLRQPANPP